MYYSKKNLEVTKLYTVPRLRAVALALHATVALAWLAAMPVL